MTKNKFAKKIVGTKRVVPQGQKDYAFGDKFRRQVKPLKKSC